jgi:ankyrin repeat protein
MAGETSIVMEFNKILHLKGDKKSLSINHLFEKYANEQSKIDALKQCLKAWDVHFEGDKEIELLNPEFDLDMPPEMFGKYFNQSIYPKVYALCNLANHFENIGHNTEHATKLCVLFKDSKSVVDYLNSYAENSMDNKHPLHDACSFVLPDFKAQGFLEEGSGCEFEVFQNMAAKGKSSQKVALKRHFKELLPYAWEIQKQVIDQSKEAKLQNITPDPIKIDELTKQITTNLSRYDSLERSKGKLTDNLKVEYHTLTNVLNTQLCELTRLNAGKSLNDLTLLELMGVSTLFKNSKEGSYLIFMENGIPAKYHEEFKSLNRDDAGKFIPDVTIDGNEFRYPGYYLMKVPVQDEMHAARAACFGKMTNCCQSLSGENGHPCVVHGLTSPYGGFYVVCQGDVKKPLVSDKVVAQSWTWRSLSEAIVFDSIEVASTNQIKLVKSFYSRLSETLATEHQVPKITCGTSSGIRDFGVQSALCDEERFKDYDNYNDSYKQNAIHDIQQPFLFYNVHDYAKKDINNFIENTLNSPSALTSDPLFIKLLNWALVEYNYDVLEKIKECANDKKRDQELFSLINSIQSFVQLDLESPTANEVLSELAGKPHLLFLRNSEKSTPLICAARNRQNDICLKMIENGADVNYHINLDDGLTPLILAAKNGLEATCLKLIEKGVNVNQKDWGGRTPLMHAADNGHEQTSLNLIEHGADVNHLDFFDDSPLLFAAEFGLEETCLKLIEKGANVNQVNSNDKTPLLYAAHNGLEKICLKLIEKGANVNQVDSNGNRPLMFAINNGHEATSLMLIEQGADVNQVDLDGNAPLLFATHKGLEETCLILIENGANINQVNSNGNTALPYAAQNGLEKTCLKLIEKGANVNQVSLNGNIPIIFAAHKGLEKTCLKLIENGANVNQVDSYGNTPLMYAIINGHEATSLKLIEKGANVNQVVSNGNTPLMFAICNGHEAISLMLIEQGADVNQAYLNGNTPLMLAILNGLEATSLKLIEQGADVNLTTLNGNSILMLAVGKGLETICLKLIEKGADVNHIDQTKNTPLFYAPMHNHAKISSLLVDKGANLHYINSNEYTPLMTAAAYGYAKTCLMFIQRGAVLDDVLITKMRLFHNKPLDEAINQYLVNLERDKENTSNKRAKPIIPSFNQEQENVDVQKQLPDEPAPMEIDLNKYNK